MENTYNLTEGALQIISQGGEINTPILQILGSKKVANSAKERYRLLLSDGQTFINYAMSTIKPNLPDGIQDYSIIRVKRYVTSIVNNANDKIRVMLLLDWETIKDGREVGRKIGNPVMATSNVVSDEPTNKMRKVESSTPSASTSTQANLSFSEDIIYPIASITPFQNRWTIKATVTNKSNMRTWSNSKGEGKLFNFDLCDESGEIRCTAFREQAEKYFDFIQIDKVYKIKKCSTKTANKSFITNHEYELTLTNESVIEECFEEENNIPFAKYNFVSFDKIASTEVNVFIDVIGICTNCSDMINFTAKKSQKELSKRDVTLVDQTGNAVTLTLWNEAAEKFDSSDNPVIVIKKAKVGEFGGKKNLSTTLNSCLKINPDIEEAHRIRGWFNKEGKSALFQNISSSTSNIDAPIMSFKKVQDENYGHSESGAFYKVYGTILLVRSDRCVYKACVTDKCNKKVIDMNNGYYKCEKCNLESNNFTYRFLASMNLGDWSGNQWVSMFNSEAEKIFGCTAQHFGELLDKDAEAANELINSLNFKKFLFTCKAKIEFYNDEMRYKTVVVKVQPINMQEYNSHLIQRINQIAALE